MMTIKRHKKSSTGCVYDFKKFVTKTTAIIFVTVTIFKCLHKSFILAL